MSNFVRRVPEGTHRAEQRATAPPPVKSSSPHPWELMLHPFKALRFVNALRRDKRISWLRKLVYVGPLLVLFVALLLPESILATVVAVVLPVVGPLASLPADAVLDWAFLGVAAYALLGILPRAIVSEYHAQLFHPGRLARQRKRQELEGVPAVNKGLIVMLILLAILLNAIAFVGFGPAFSTYLRSCYSSISSPYPTSCSTSASSAVVIGFVLYLSGVIAAIIAWIVGLITTARIRRWGWFVAVLILPVLGSLLYGLIGPATKPQY